MAKYSEADPDQGSDGNCVDKTSGERGQKIWRSFGRDDSSFGSKEIDEVSKNGHKMGGSVTNLGHTITGGSAVQHVKAKSGPGYD